MILTDQRGPFEFGNSDAAYVAVRQAIRGVVYTLREHQLLTDFDLCRRYLLRVDFIPVEDELELMNKLNTGCVKFGASRFGETKAERKKRISDAQTFFDKCWLEVCRYYIRTSAQVIFVTAAHFFYDHNAEILPIIDNDCL